MAPSSKKPQQKPSSVKPKLQSQQPANPEKAKKANLPSTSRTFLEITDNWLIPKMNLIFYFSLLLTVLFGILLFDVKISTGGDDSGYIEMANGFMKGRSFPSWHGPLYPIFLSIPMLIFGVNVLWLKLFSFVFIIAHLILFYFTFRKHVSSTLSAFSLLIVAVSSSILYFASQTYSEAMFMFLQSLIVFIFINEFINKSTSGLLSLKEEALSCFILGFFVFLASLTRNIGIVALLAMIFFMLIEKRFRGALMLALSYFFFFVPFKIYKSIVWESGGVNTKGQLSEILLKNPYNKALGNEDFSGMIVRFFENARLYLSKHFMIGIGLHDPSTTGKSWLVTLIIAFLFLIALYYAFKRSKILLFVAIYLGASISATFIALQQTWDQMRMVVIYIPMLLLLLVWGIQQLATEKKYRFLGLLLPFLLALIFFKTLGYSIDKMKANQKVLAKNISGNQYYGFTPDWQNYLLMSEWVGKNIPGEVVVAARKPSMSFIYSKGRDFYGIYRFPTETPEALLGALKQRTGELMVLPNKTIQANWPVELQLAIKQSNVAYVAEGSDIYGVYDFKNSTGQGVIQALNGFQVKPMSSDSLLNRLKISSQSTFAVSPDTLINNLRRNKVDYIIVASLRANPNMNTGNIINNIQRYLYFVEQKYPGILQVVHQIGMKPEEEPAWLYQVNYQLYGL